MLKVQKMTLPMVGVHRLWHVERIGGGVGKLCVDLVAERRGVEPGYRGKAENR